MPLSPASGDGADYVCVCVCVCVCVLCVRVLKICVNRQQISTLYRCSFLMSFNDRYMYILCDTLQSNIINVIFVEDGNHFMFIRHVATGAKICDLF